MTLSCQVLSISEGIDVIWVWVLKTGPRVELMLFQTRCRQQNPNNMFCHMLFTNEGVDLSFGCGYLSLGTHKSCCRP